MRILSFCLILALTLTSCSIDDHDHVAILRLDKTLESFASEDIQVQRNIADSLAPEIDAMFAAMGRPNPTLAELDAWSRSNIVAMFQPDIDSVFPNLDKLETEVGSILGNAQKYGLELPPLCFTAVAWGRPQPIVRVDSIVLIALNHFLGREYRGYSHLESFRRDEKSSESLAYAIAGALAATQHPFATSAAPTVLNWMLYEGALVEARMRLVPDSRLSLALGYEPEQLEYLEDHTKEMWEELAIRKWIYSTDPVLIDRLVAPAPSTPLLNSQAPGRAGRYMGYKIVKEYQRKHPSVQLDFLLSPAFYDSQETLLQSGF